MKETLWIDLQRFAGEGAAPGGEGGGEGSAVESSADDGQGRTLESLGVPKEKAERFRKRRAEATEKIAASAPPPRDDAAAAAEAAQEQTAEAAAGEEAGEPTRKTLKQLLQEDPELNKEAQEIVKARLREYDKAEGKNKAALQTLDPALKILQKFYGQEGELDAEKLAEAIGKDDRYFESMAEELGTSSDVARKLYERDQLIEADRARRESERQERAAREDFERLWQQGEELKKTYPSFDLRTEMQNDVFRRMVMPGGGLTVKQAFMALHGEEIRRAENAAIAEKVKEELARSIAAGQSRPVEGKRGQGASSGALTPELSREDREALKKRIRESYYTGQKIYPGG